MPTESNLDPRAICEWIDDVVANANDDETSSDTDYHVLPEVPMQTPSEKRAICKWIKEVAKANDDRVLSDTNYPAEYDGGEQDNQGELLQNHDVSGEPQPINPFSFPAAPAASNPNGHNHHQVSTVAEADEDHNLFLTFTNLDPQPQQPAPAGEGQQLVGQVIQNDANNNNTLNKCSCDVM